MFLQARFHYFLFSILLCTAAASAQQNPSPGSSPTEPGNRKITLDVVVTPKSGPPVTGLQQQDFTLLDNKSPQTIASFQAITGRDARLEVILVIDAVNIGAVQVANQRIQIDKFLRADAGRLAYPIALAVFTDDGIRILGNFSSDGNALSAALDRDDLSIPSIGRSRLLRCGRTLGAFAQSSSSACCERGSATASQGHALGLSRLASPVRYSHQPRLEAGTSNLRQHCEIFDRSHAGPCHPL